MTVMTHKGYIASVEYDADAQLFHGEVKNVTAVLTFQGSSAQELEAAFADTIDDYLDWCAERGKEPEKPFSGKLSLRLPPEVHRALAVEAARRNTSLNRLIAETLSREA